MTKADYDKKIRAGKDKINDLKEKQQRLREARRALVKEKEAFKNTSYKDNRAVTSIVHWKGYFAEQFQKSAQALLKDEDNYKLKSLTEHIEKIDKKLENLKDEQSEAEKSVRSWQRARSREYPYG